MGNFFLIFSLFVLVSSELLLGNMGIYVPFLLLGIFYFAQTRPLWLMVSMGILLALILDNGLYGREWMPTLWCVGVVAVCGFYWRPYRIRGILFNGIPGALIFFAATSLEYLPAMLRDSGFYPTWPDYAALTATALIWGYFFWLMILLGLDFFAKKLHLSTALVLDHSLTIKQRIKLPGRKK